jgi:anti-sigma-K factor RskA
MAAPQPVAAAQLSGAVIIMSDPNVPSDQADALAAEYVIGVLDAVARGAAKQRMRTDIGFAARVAIWEVHLEGFNEEYGTQAPPKRVKAGIDQHLFGLRKRRWLGWAPLGLATAAILLILVLLPQFMPHDIDLRARLDSDGSPYAFSVAVDRGRNLIDMKVITGDAPLDGTFELWLIAEGGAPVSLGTFEKDQVVNLLPDVALMAKATLAISLEPSGGSPTGAPTGPVVAIGALEDA